MRGFASKVGHVMKTEGLGSLTNRTQRYLRYRWMRAWSDRRSVVSDWESLRGTYAGERAFLIGNGPSLNLTELYLLRNEATMCFNRFDLMLERLNWLPTFYTTIDDRVLLDTTEVANRMSELASHAFFPDIHPYCVDFRHLIHKRPNVHWLFLDKASFSDQLPYCGINKTVANVGIQILAYLGFKEINLLGMDMTYSVPKTARVENPRDVTATEDDDESHFDPRYFGKGRRFHVPMLDETFRKFREARAYFESRGVRIRNATVGGALHEFPRATLDKTLRVPQAQKRAEFEEMVAGKLRDASVDVLDEVESRAPSVEVPEDVDPSWDVFRARSEAAQSIVMKQILSFVPFGPLAGRHLWVNRRLLREDPAPRPEPLD